MTKNPFKSNKWEIYYNIINALLFGGVYFIGNVTALREVTTGGIVQSLLISLGIFLIKFRDYWVTQEREYKNCKKICKGKKGRMKLFSIYPL